MAADTPELVVLVGLVAALRQLELDPVVRDRQVHDLQAGVLQRELANCLDVVPMVHGALVRSVDAHRDDEEDREGDKRHRAVLGVPHVLGAGDDQAGDAQREAADDEAEVAEIQCDEGCSQHLSVLSGREHGNIFAKGKQTINCLLTIYLPLAISSSNFVMY